MYLQLFAELIPILNKCSVIMKLLLSLAHYHIIYLIVKLFQINVMFIWLKDYFIFIGPFINIPSTASRIFNILATH
jgi:hypothetical protein